MLSIASVWKNHGTKVIGFGSAALGALAYIDHSTIQVVETTLGPKYGPITSHGLLIGAGLATAYRGFKNSQRPDDK